MKENLRWRDEAEFPKKPSDGEGDLPKEGGEEVVAFRSIVRKKESPRARAR